MKNFALIAKGKMIFIQKKIINIANHVKKSCVENAKIFTIIVILSII